MTATTKRKTTSLKVLMTKLGEYQSSFNDIWEFVEDVPADAVAFDMSIRIERLDELREKIENTIIEVKSHSSYSEEKYPIDSRRKDFSVRFYKMKAFLMDQLKQLQEPTPILDRSFHAGESSVGGSLDHARLPQIRLQVFNGDINEWLSFRDLFTSLIHWRTDLPEIEKFHYLKGCLQGEPKGLIDPIQITKTNYQVAWNLLVERYSNSKQLKKRQVQILFDLPVLARESVADLHKLVDSFQRAVQTLDQIIQPGDYKDLLLINLLISRLDPTTRRGWEEFSSSKDQETLKDLTGFLQRRIGVLEAIPPRQVDIRAMQRHAVSSSTQKPKAIAVKTSFNTVQESSKGCVCCSADHFLFQCPVFQKMTSSDKEALLRAHGLCRNCLKQGHQAKDCRSKFSCRKCRGRHHTLVCFKPERDGNGAANTSTNTSNLPAKLPQGTSSNHPQMVNMAISDATVSNSARCFSSQALLATAVVIIKDDYGNQFPARALLDSGSECNFLTEQMSQRLKVTRNTVDISVLGIGQSAAKVNQRVRAVVCSRVSSYSREFNFLVLRRVTANLPTTSIDPIGWKIPDGIELADPTFFISRTVDLVLGVEAFFDFFVTGRQLPLGDQLPILTESVFGWVVCGGTSLSSQTPITCHISASKELEMMVARFWSCEEIELSRTYSPKQTRCEQLYVNTVQRDTDGRYTVSILKDGDEFKSLGESHDIAIRRLQGTERRLAKDARLREQYTAFMEEYLALGHMQPVDDTHDAVKRCYLPHHPVIKEASTTTKLRVVFDASSKTTTGVSLNDTLHVGPVIQEDLRSIILRCRTKQVMLVSDIEKMFRQIKVLPEDRPLQCILWRKHPTQDVVTYELGTVTYGTKSAPFLATRTLQQLVADEGQCFPQAAKAILEDTYMDDVITGADTIEEATDLRKQLVEMLQCGGFRLRKWASNEAATLQGLTQQELAYPDTTGIELDPDFAVKTLGLTWVPSADEFRYQFKLSDLDVSESITKRKILASVASLYDPPGLLGPAITMAKIFLQELWTWRSEDGHKLDWDDPVPSTVGERWRKFYELLPMLNQIRISRCAVIPKSVSLQLHCFSDASQRAYGDASIYVVRMQKEQQLLNS
ncbi:uncharacterized protein LOC134204615 [Armigeres subalbatus]|uniref:uncharacterized protein LOC134204615 n=1 Tax=Armigeres subalbatus TaxID=124917 RepID=UPI002ED1DA9E